MSAPMDTRLYRNIQIALGVVTLLWAVHLLNIVMPTELRFYGLRPRRPDGLSGILFAPFLHGSFKHLMSNSGPLLILLIVSLSFSRRQTVAALFIIMGLGGGAVWLFGRPGTVHIGASGVIFGLIGFLMFIGIFQRQWKALIFSVVVFMGYGSALMTLLVYMPGVSWSSHFWGFMAGVAAAWQMRHAATDK